MARREDDDDENDGEPRAVSLVEEIFDERTHALQHNIHIPATTTTTSKADAAFSIKHLHHYAVSLSKRRLRSRLRAV
jgi:hypothetical protein